MKQYIAYEGCEFTVEWYYDGRGRSQAFKYFEELPIERQRKILNLLG